MLWIAGCVGFLLGVTMMFSPIGTLLYRLQYALMHIGEEFEVYDDPEDGEMVTGRVSALELFKRMDASMARDAETRDGTKT